MNSPQHCEYCRRVTPSKKWVCTVCGVCKPYKEEDMRDWTLECDDLKDEITKLKSELCAKQTKIDKLVEALEFYGDKDWEIVKKSKMSGDLYMNDKFIDLGKRARNALADVKEMG